MDAALIRIRQPQGGFELGGMSRPQNHNAAAQFLISTGIARNGWRRLAPSLYDGGAIVRRSIGMGQPIVFVSMNYRGEVLGVEPCQPVLI